MKTHISVIFAALSIVSIGCATNKKEAQNPETTMVVGAAPISDASQRWDAEPAPVVSRNAYGAKEVYTRPQIRKVYVDAYVDENGNAFGPQEKYIVVKSADWNMDALRNPAKAYIPQDMLPNAESPGSYTVTNPTGDRRPTPTKTVREIYNIDQIVVTGFVERNQEPQVIEIEARYGGKMVRIFDEDGLGWILVPKTALAPINK